MCRKWLEFKFIPKNIRKKILINIQKLECGDYWQAVIIRTASKGGSNDWQPDTSRKN